VKLLALVGAAAILGVGSGLAAGAARRVSAGARLPSGKAPPVGRPAPRHMGATLADLAALGAFAAPKRQPRGSRFELRPQWYNPLLPDIGPRPGVQLVGPFTPCAPGEPRYPSKMGGVSCTPKAEISPLAGGVTWVGLRGKMNGWLDPVVPNVLQRWSKLATVDKMVAESELLIGLVLRDATEQGARKGGNAINGYPGSVSGRYALVEITPLGTVREVWARHLRGFFSPTGMQWTLIDDAAAAELRRQGKESWDKGWEFFSVYQMLVPLFMLTAFIGTAVAAVPAIVEALQGISAFSSSAIAALPAWAQALIPDAVIVAIGQLPSTVALATSAGSLWAVANKAGGQG